MQNISSDIKAKKKKIKVEAGSSVKKLFLRLSVSSCQLKLFSETAGVNLKKNKKLVNKRIMCKIA